MMTDSTIPAAHVDADRLLACPDCDCLALKPELRLQEIARCRYCGAVLARGHRGSPESVIALSLASLILFALANTFPFVSLQAGGIEREIRLASGLVALVEADLPLPGVVAIAFILVAPILRLAGYLYVLLPLWLRVDPPAWRLVLRTANAMLPWSMLEIYLLAVVVAIVKISELGVISVGASFWAFAMLVGTSTWLSSIADRFAIWEMVESWRQCRV